MSEPVFIIIPVHNRKSITLKLLKTLHHDRLLNRYQVVVIDDGSTDGTSEAIEDSYPQVIILEGDGNLWWTGAIVKGMQFAIDQGAEFLIWLNDDTIPEPDTIPQLVAVCKSNPHLIASAQCYGDPDFTIPTYGAQKKQGFSIGLKSTLPGEIQACDALSGNLVCFSRQLVEAIGYPNAQRAPHCQADIVYTYKAKKAGFTPTVLGDAIALCEMNPLDIGWINSPVNMLKRWQALGSFKSNLYPPSYWYFCQTFYGRWAVIPFVNVYLRLVILTGLIWIIPSPALKAMKKWKDQWF